MSTHIQWTDETWNVVTGCDRVSPGCDHCYIERTIPFRREGRHFDEHGKMGIRLHPDRIERPLHWRKPRRVFVNSLSDMFHPDIPRDFIERVWDVMRRTPQHTYQLLTKRPQHMRRMLCDRPATPQEVNDGYELGVVPGIASDGVMPNVWLGVSVENQRYADLRIPPLLATPAVVRFLSCEPLLGPVDLSVDLTDYLPSLDWVIIGGESGPGARPMQLVWARSLRDQCAKAAVPVFVKQLGRVWGMNNGADAKGGEMRLWPEDLRVREFPADE